MIVSYRDRRAEAFANGEFVRAFQGCAEQAQRRLAILNVATSVHDLGALRSNRLEALHGDRKVNSASVSTSSGASASNGSGARGPQKLGISPTELARQIGVPPSRISQILRGQRAITGDTAVRLAHWFEMSAEFWINLQAQYDITIAKLKLGNALDDLPRKSA